MLGAEPVPGSGGPDRAAGEDDEIVAETLDHVELVRGEEDRGAAGRAGLQDPGDDVNREGVQAGEGLVEDQHLGVVHERRGDLRALLVAQ